MKSFAVIAPFPTHEIGESTNNVVQLNVFSVSQTLQTFYLSLAKFEKEVKTKELVIKLLCYDQLSLKNKLGKQASNMNSRLNNNKTLPEFNRLHVRLHVVADL